MKIRLAIFVMLALMATYSTSRLLKQNPRGPDRQVAAHKMTSSHHGHHHGHMAKELPISHTQKLSSPLKVSLELVGPAPQKSGDTFQLRVHLKTSQALDQALLTWDIPEGLKMVSGSVEQSFLNLESGQNQSFDVLFEQVSDNNEQLHVILKSQSPGMQFSSMAQFNSIDQVEIDRSVSSLKQRSDDYIQKQQQKNGQ